MYLRPKSSHVIIVHLGSSTECVTPIESLTVVPRVVLGPCLTRLVDVPFPRNTQNSKAINCVISMLSSDFWIKLASEKTHMQPQEYDKKTSFGPWTILSVYLPFKGQTLPWIEYFESSFKSRSFNKHRNLGQILNKST